MPSADAEFKLTGTAADIRMVNEIEALNKNLKNAQQTLGQTWNPDKDDDGKWIATSHAHHDKTLVG